MGACCIPSAEYPDGRRACRPRLLARLGRGVSLSRRILALDETRFWGSHMWRSVLGVVTGIVVWVALVTAGGLAMRTFWTAYAAADTPAMTFYLAMKIARLTLSSVTLIIASIVAVRVARPSRYVALAFGVVLLI